MIFKDRVYQITSAIPKGKVATYGYIAKLAGKPRAARVVGMYMRINPFAPRVPCHRVVAFDGKLTGYSAPGGIKKKRTMLIREGVRFKKDRVDLVMSGWNADIAR